jgi:chromate transporter
MPDKDSLSLEKDTPSSPSVADRESGMQGEEPVSILHLALYFLKIGAIGFGGGMAVIALIERECVRRRCVEAEEFLHGVGLGQILGPFAVNAALFVGYHLYGLLGGLVAAVSFLLPSIVAVIVLSWLYFAFHKIPSLQGALAGLGPVVIALIFHAAWSMGRKSLRSWMTFLVAILSCLASMVHINPVWILLTAGLIGLAFRLAARPNPSDPTNGPETKILAALPLAATGTINHGTSLLNITSKMAVQAGSQGALAATTISLATLGVVFLKVGFVFFGGGFVLIPVLHQHLVNELGWLSAREFLDGVAISQLTPGPIAVLATFAGYHVAGIGGALVATLALFLPSTLLMLLISYYYDRLRNVRSVQDFLAGIVPAVVGLILATGISLAPANLHVQHPASIVLCAAAFLLLSRSKWHPAFVLAIGALAGSMSSSLYR